MSAEIPSLIASLQSEDSAERQAAAEKLAQLETDAQAAAVPLVEACAADDEAHEWVVAALEGLGAPSATDIVKLTALLNSSSLDVAYWAATLLGRLEAQAAPAVDPLIEVLGADGHLAVRERAAWALGRIGPAASLAREPLATAAACTEPRLASLARDALRRLDL